MSNSVAIRHANRLLGTSARAAAMSTRAARGARLAPPLHHRRGGWCRVDAFQTVPSRGAPEVPTDISMQAKGEPFQPLAEKAVMKALEKSLGSELSYGPMVPKPEPSVIVISGPSGVGKDAVIKELQRRREDLHFVVTATSRGMRAGEVDGVDYVFTTAKDFEDMIDGGELLEHAVVYGEYKGIPKQQVRDALARGTDVVLRLDVQGAETIRKMIPKAVSIFIVAESEASLVQRLVARKTEPMDKILVRVQTAREETQRMGEFDYVVVNADQKLEQAVDNLCAIIDAEKLRVKQEGVKL